MQKHAARRLHYDFRLELDGVLKSWPIPKGPSHDPKEKRLAVMTEDHPLDYATFEGIIPRGEYGGGQVIVWDAGIYAPEIDERPCWDQDQASERVRSGIERGLLTVWLHGQKLRGGWTLVRTKTGDWLFLKKQDDRVDPSLDVTLQDRSVLSDLTIEDLKSGRLPYPTRHPTLILAPGDLLGAVTRAFPAPFAPMLPNSTQQPFADPSWVFEPKLDGFRVLAFVHDGNVRLFSRREIDNNGQYPWLVRELGQQPYRDIVIDGEIVALDAEGRPSFQLMQNRASNGQPLIYYVFDILYRDGYDLRGVPLEHRRRLLERSVIPTANVRVVDVYPEDGPAIYAAAVASGMEGVVAKRKDSRYETGRRSSAWLKIKETRTGDFVVGGFNRGEGARASSFGSLVLGVPEDGTRKLAYVGHVGSGFDDRSLKQVLARLEPLVTPTSPFVGEVPINGRWSRRADAPITWVRPELVAEVKYAQRTDDGILRAPVFLRLRDDKAPAEAGVEVGVPPPTEERSNGQPTTDEDYARVLQQLEQAGGKLKLELDGYTLGLTNLDKIMWPEHEGERALTKRDLMRYFVSVAPALLPHLRDRPLTLVRFPNGIAGGHFYQKHYDQPMPAFVQTVRIYSDQNAGDGDYVVCNNLPTLIWLAQLADLELHTWYSRVNPEPDAEGRPTVFSGSVETMRASVLNYPDFIVFDLDPYLYSGKEAPGDEPELHRAGFTATCEVAVWLKAVLDSLSLSSFVKTTGKTGLHIYVPILRNLDYSATHAVAETLARYLVQQHPQRVTAEWAVEQRRGKVFVDYNQNVRGKTLASIYSARVLPWAAVSMPLTWSEVEHGGSIFPTDFTILSAPQRLREQGDPWASILDAKHDLSALASAS